MPEQPQPSPPATSQILANLHAVARLLRESKYLGPEEQQLVAELVDELAKALESPQAADPELARLAEPTTQLLQAVQQRHDTNLLTNARLRLEEAIIDAEARAPVLVGLVQRLLEMLAASGI
jgi:hypothetical protein